MSPVLSTLAARRSRGALALRFDPAFLAGLLMAAPLAAQHQHGAHQTREPEALTAPGPFGNLSVASGDELSLVLFSNALTQAVLVCESDGRALNGTWSAPQPVSGAGGGARFVQRDSIHVDLGLGFAVWLEDRASSADSRIFYNVRTSAGWGQPRAIGDAGLPANADILAYRAVFERSLSGAPCAAVLYSVLDPATQAQSLWISTSGNGGFSFQAPVPVAEAGPIPGGSATRIGGLALDLQLAELHCAWTDDRSGTSRVYYRRGGIDFFGRAFFYGPLATGERLISAPGSRAAADDLMLQVNGERRWTGSSQKYVGIAWREDGALPGTASLFVRASHDSGSNFLSPAIVAHTGRSGIAVRNFDFEILGDTFAITWADNARLDPQGNVVIPTPAESHIWRAESSDGSTFDPLQGANVAQLSAQSDPLHVGRAPKIAYAEGTPDAGMIAFLDVGPAGPEVATTFSDQEYGGEWHGDDFPIVSEAQGEGPGHGVPGPALAYNKRYNNFVVAWAQESAPNSLQWEIHVGGYRPQQVEIEGWEVGSNEIHFVFEHLPFEDTFAFVLLSQSASNAFGGNLLLPDQRKTGLIPDALTFVGLELFGFFAAPIDPAIEGAETIGFPIPPDLPVGLPISFCGVSWGPFGEFHLLTETVTELVTDPGT